ncbi:MAG: hypothetical protein JNK47_10290 [Mesorhizobium sp.]|nr:hypothetical protein [Mesorhizobium sp.]MBL8577606.1 hypothetical protein [Mesorhizobium sp.]
MRDFTALTVAGRHRRLRKALPLGILAAIAMLALSLPVWSDVGFSVFSFFNTFQNAATLGLLALAVGLTVMIGEFDLSSIAIFTLGGLLAVKFGEASPMSGIAIAVAAGALLGAVQGGLLVLTGISSVPLTLGGYIVILGLCHIVAGEGILAYGNYDIGIWLDDPVALLFSKRSLLILAVFLLLWLAMRFTRLGSTIRSVGADRRAALASGVSVSRTVAGVFILSGMLCALGGALFSYSASVAKYDLGLDPFIFAVTAVLLGGINVSGGRGNVLGILAGVVAMSLLDTIFIQLAMPTYLIDLARGALLLIVVLIEAPDLARSLTAWKAGRIGAAQAKGRDHSKPLANSGTG